VWKYVKREEKKDREKEAVQ
jgi:hypothetical protein